MLSVKTEASKILTLHPKDDSNLEKTCITPSHTERFFPRYCHIPIWLNTIHFHFIYLNNGKKSLKPSTNSLFKRIPILNTDCLCLCTIRMFNIARRATYVYYMSCDATDIQQNPELKWLLTCMWWRFMRPLFDRVKCSIFNTFLICDVFSPLNNVYVYKRLVISQKKRFHSLLCLCSSI